MGLRNTPKVKLAEACSATLTLKSAPTMTQP